VGLALAGPAAFLHWDGLAVEIEKSLKTTRSSRASLLGHGNNANEHEKENIMNEHDASRVARESVDKTLETGAETVGGLQEGFASTLEICAM
jgi:hypothetical protein